MLRKFIQSEILLDERNHIMSNLRTRSGVSRCGSTLTNKVSMSSCLKFWGQAAGYQIEFCRVVGHTSGREVNPKNSILTRPL